jgi:hypothetical protein
MTGRSLLASLSLISSAIVACGGSIDASTPSPPQTSGPATVVVLPEAVNALAQDDRFVYAATEVRLAAAHSTIYRIDKADFRVETLLTVPPDRAAIAWLFADVDGLYWLNTGTEGYGIWRARHDGTLAELLIGRSDWAITGVMVNAERVFYVEEDALAFMSPTPPAPPWRVRSVPKAGGPVTAEPRIHGRGLVADERFVYSCAEDGVYSCAQDGGLPERIAAPPCGKLVRDGERLSWVHNPLVVAHGENGDYAVTSETTLYEMPRHGGIPSKLTVGNVVALASNGGQHFLLDYPVGDPRRLVVKSTSAELLTVSFGSANLLLPAGEILADRARVYWSEPRKDLDGWHGVVRSVRR